jgi:hypothetical protein
MVSPNRIQEVLEFEKKIVSKSQNMKGGIFWKILGHIITYTLQEFL